MIGFMIRVLICQQYTGLLLSNLQLSYHNGCIYSLIWLPQQNNLIKFLNSSPLYAEEWLFLVGPMKVTVCSMEKEIPNTKMQLS